MAAVVKHMPMSTCTCRAGFILQRNQKCNAAAAPAAAAAAAAAATVFQQTHNAMHLRLRLYVNWLGESGNNAVETGLHKTSVMLSTQLCTVPVVSVIWLPFLSN
jgi:hypothetical protein